MRGLASLAIALARLRSSAADDQLVGLPSTAFIDVEFHLRCESETGQRVQLLVDPSGRS